MATHWLANLGDLRVIRKQSSSDQLLVTTHHMARVVTTFAMRRLGGSWPKMAGNARRHILARFRHDADGHGETRIDTSWHRMALGILLVAMIVGGTTATLLLLSGGGMLAALGLYCASGVLSVLTLASIASLIRNQATRRSDARLHTGTAVRYSAR